MLNQIQLYCVGFNLLTKNVFGSDVWQLDYQNSTVKVFDNTLQLDFGSLVFIFFT